jgi:hypothetical protein
MWEFFDRIGTIIGIISVIIAAWSAWKLRSETKRQWQKENGQIRVILRGQGEEYILPIELRRGNLTRAELLGLIGMLPMKVKPDRFEITFLSSHEFSNRLASIRNSDDSFAFIIPCSDAELGQFKISLTPITLDT